MELAILNNLDTVEVMELALEYIESGRTRSFKEAIDFAVEQLLYV